MSDIYTDLLEAVREHIDWCSDDLDETAARADIKRVFLRHGYSPPLEKGQCSCVSKCAAPRIMGRQTACVRDPSAAPGRELDNATS